MLIIDGKEYLNIQESIEYLDIQDTEKHMEKYGIKRFKQTIGQIRFHYKEDLKKNNDCNYIITQDGLIYIEFDYFKKSVELCLKSIPVGVLVEEIIETTKKRGNLSRQNILYKLEVNENLYFIDLFSRSERFISIADFEILLKKHYIFLKKDCITINELTSKINNIYHGFECKPSTFRHIINTNNIEVFFNYRYDYIEPGKLLVPAKSVDQIMKIFNDRVRDNIMLVNVSFEEYISLEYSEFKEIYKEVTTDDFKKIVVTKKNLTTTTGLAAAFKDTDVKAISMYKKVFVSKKEFEELIDFKQNYVPAREAIFNEIGVLFNSGVAKSAGIDDIKKYKNTLYIKKSDIDLYIKRNNQNQEYAKLVNIYERFKFKIDNEPHWKNNKFPEVRDLMLEYCKSIKSKSEDTLAVYPGKFYKLYKLILDNIKVNLVNENEIANNELFTNILSSEDTIYSNAVYLIGFINFLRLKKGFKLKIFSGQRNKKDKEKAPYTAESFINLLGCLLEIIYDKEKIKKLYRNWNLSSSILYVLLHYSVAWRRGDLISKIPIIDLRLIDPSIKDGETFIEWLEDGNTPSIDSYMEVCKSIEEQTKRLRLKAKKNKSQLHCIISDALIEPIGTLLFLNEANRQIHLKRVRCGGTRKRYESMNENYTRSNNIQKQLKKHFKIDIEKILGGSFDNTRMNKGFLTLVQAKSQELNLFGYYYAQILRSHVSSKKNRLSETTKIYLKKSIDENAVKVFATGTMGSIAYMLNQLVDKTFDKKDISKQISIINETNITPYTAEKTIQMINNKVSKMNKIVDRYFTKGISKKNTKENLLLEILYGDNYGIEERTKCLIKITNKENCITRIEPLNEHNNGKVRNGCPLGRRTCIGCDYVIALRYFIYTFEQKFNYILTKLENAKSEYDKELIKDIINRSYIPLINDLAAILSDEEIYKVIDVERYAKLAQSY